MIVSLLLLVIGVPIMIDPHILWNLTEVWKNVDFQGPMDLYLTNTRFCGMLLSFMGFLLSIIYILK